MPLTGCKYGSYKQAFDACKEWEDKGGKYTIYNFRGDSQEYKRDLRKCRNEKETDQVLGLELKNIKVKSYSDIEYYNISKENRNETEVKKRFKY